MITSIVDHTLCDTAMLEASRVARDTQQHLLVGLEELPDGTGRFGHMREVDARVCETFSPGWLVTPEGRVAAWRPASSDRGRNARTSPRRTEASAASQESAVDRSAARPELVE